MKRFVLKVIVFLLPIFVLAGICELYLRSMPNDYMFKNQNLKSIAKDVKVLALGSSHSYYGINPEYLSMRGFNLSHISQSIDIDKLLIEKYVDQLEQLEYIVLPISYFTLFGNLQDGEQAWRIKNYEIYYDLDIAQDFENGTEFFGNTGLANLKRVLVNFRNSGKTLTCNTSGYGIRSTQSKNTNFSESGEEASLRHTKESFEKFEYNYKIVEEIILLAKKRGIEVLLITTPAFDTYVENLSKNQLELMIDACNNLSDTYSNVEYEYYLDSTKFSQNDFFDADHLNDNGARKLTILIDKKLQAMAK